jgi:UDP-N-acetylmuramate dehydrogenase
MAPLTTFRIGGPAALYMEPEDGSDLEAVSGAVAESGIAVLVVGKGSNLLVSDAGFEGLVLRLGSGFRWAARDGAVLTAGGAMPLPALSGIALRHHLGGLEFAAAIPASLGGAVRMNAGAHGRQLSDVAESVDIYELAEGVRRTIPAQEMGFAYRRSAFPERAVVTAAAIRRRMQEARDWRRRTQPVAEPNCGSVFKNPEGSHAARLIEGAGLKGARVGGARVSDKHANFIVTSEGARAADVWALMRLVRETVSQASGVFLEPEVHAVGAFPDA